MDRGLSVELDESEVVSVQQRLAKSMEKDHMQSSSSQISRSRKEATDTLT